MNNNYLKLNGDFFRRWQTPPGNRNLVVHIWQDKKKKKKRENFKNWDECINYKSMDQRSFVK